MSNNQILDRLLDGNDLEESQAYELMQQFAAGDLDPAFANACRPSSERRNRG